MRVPHCMNNHGRVEMYVDFVNRKYVCPMCKETVAPEQILREVPQGMRPQRDSLAAAIQSLADFDVRGVIRDGGRIFIEYPRRNEE